MSEPGRELSLDEQIAVAVQDLGQAVLGRALNADEADALRVILHAAADALKHGHGFINRLAAQVQEERNTENVEEFFEGVINTD